MRKSSKKVFALAMSAMLMLSLPMTAGAKSGTFTAVGAPYCKSWSYSLTSTKVASAFYRLTGKMSQLAQYRFNVAEMRITLYCDGPTNVVKNVSGTDVYTLEGFADASTGVSRGDGSMYVHVDDNLYGHYTGTFYSNE